QRKFSYCVGLWMVLSLAGCDQNRSIESFAVADAGSAPSKTSSVLDVEIVLSDRPGYTCIPLDRIGLPSDAQIVRMESSCECVKPRCVTYAAPGSQRAQGLLVEFIPEDRDTDPGKGSHATQHPPMLLGVIVQVHLADGTRRDFNVDLLHTTLLENTSSAEVSP
ncbi:MAG: hypothetical protein ACK6A7_24460, partial [Planctomycetota bacterium]